MSVDLSVRTKHDVHMSFQDQQNVCMMWSIDYKQMMSITISFKRVTSNHHGTSYPSHAINLYDRMPEWVTNKLLCIIKEIPLTIYYLSNHVRYSQDIVPPERLSAPNQVQITKTHSPPQPLLVACLHRFCRHSTWSLYGHWTLQINSIHAKFHIMQSFLWRQENFK